MMNLFIKGMASGDRGCCSLTIKEQGDVLYKTFDKFIHTKEADIPLISGKAMYQTELYALTWGVAIIPESEPVTVWTNSMAVCAWVNNRDTPDTYKPLFDIYLRISEGRNIKARQVNLGQNRTMCKIRDKAMALMSEMGL